ncbi:translation initiation factor IF-2-like [Vulpes lagopus]|uniref:translation initiation factor IF-2-like n=1 Tax=Vulpes lagopus TaxID=494514 RepID=UPI001BC9A6D2|nr:translation initiation factor IF-2-like [Vulpes lagopus]
MCAGKAEGTTPQEDGGGLQWRTHPQNGLTGHQVEGREPAAGEGRGEARGAAAAQRWGGRGGGGAERRAREAAPRERGSGAAPCSAGGSEAPRATARGTEARRGPRRGRGTYPDARGGGGGGGGGSSRAEAAAAEVMAASPCGGRLHRAASLLRGPPSFLSPAPKLLPRDKQTRRQGRPPPLLPPPRSAPPPPPGPGPVRAPASELRLQPQPQPQPQRARARARGGGGGGVGSPGTSGRRDPPPGFGSRRAAVGGTRRSLPRGPPLRPGGELRLKSPPGMPQSADEGCEGRQPFLGVSSGPCWAGKPPPTFTEAPWRAATSAKGPEAAADGLPREHGPPGTGPQVEDAGLRPGPGRPKRS